MLRASVVACLIVLTTTTNARAQLAVIDPANLVQTILIAERAWDHYQELRRQYETIQRLSRGLGSMAADRIPAIPIAAHDPSRWDYAGQWVAALNGVDPAARIVGRDGNGGDSIRSHT